jgi:hypothetical protein
MCRPERSYLQKSRFIEDAICHDIDYFDPGFRKRQSELQGLRLALKKNETRANKEDTLHLN